MTYYSFSHYNGKEWLCVSCTPSSTIQLHSTVAKGQLRLPLMKPISTECTHIIWVHISWSMLKISTILVKPSAPPSRSFHILTQSCLQESLHPGDFYDPDICRRACNLQKWSQAVTFIFLKKIIFVFIHHIIFMGYFHSLWSKGCPSLDFTLQQDFIKIWAV